MPTLVRDIKVALSSTGERMYTHFPQEFIILTRLEVLNLAAALLKMAEKGAIQDGKTLIGVMLYARQKLKGRKK